VLLLAVVAWPLLSGRVPGPLVPAVLATVAAVLAFVWTRPSGPASGDGEFPDEAAGDRRHAPGAAGAGAVSDPGPGPGAEARRTESGRTLSGARRDAERA